MNPFAGEVTVTLDGVPHVAKLTLGALAELEAVLEAGSLIELVQRFEGGRFTTRDVLAVVVAGLRGGGWRGTAADLLHADIGGGASGAARASADLLHRAFAMP
ncbi:gene transfer agent family protein [Cereibacter sp. SYSU M97828]|nr:gene transfer agent family protein [Cereibacter flavus]